MKSSRDDPTSIIKFIRLRELLKFSSMARSTIYLRISENLWPRPVKLGERISGWPEYEIAELQAAQLAGKNKAEIRKLVDQIHAARGGQAEPPTVIEAHRNSPL